MYNEEFGDTNGTVEEGISEEFVGESGEKAL